MPTQPRTQPFPSDLFNRYKEKEKDVLIMSCQKLIEHQKHVIAGLRAFNTKVVRQKHKNN